MCVDMNPQFISGLMGPRGLFGGSFPAEECDTPLSHQRVNMERKRRLKRNVPSPMKTAGIVNPVILDTTGNYVLIQTQSFMINWLFNWCRSESSSE